MKTSLLRGLSMLSLFVLIAVQKAAAQACGVSNITIKLNNATNNAGKCQVNVDISWDQVNNGGNKYTNIHIWTQASYPNPQLTYANPPTLSQLSAALGTVVVSNPTSATPTLNATYPNAPTTPMLAATGVVKTYVSGTGINTVNRFTLKGVTMNIPGACSAVTKIVADIWSSNSNSDNAVQCSKPNNSFFVNDPLVSGSVVCNPRTFTVTIASQSTAKTATYNVYSDEGVPGVLDAADPVIFTSGTVNVPAPAGGSYTSSPTAFSTGIGNNLWVRVQVTGDAFTTTALINNSCPVLPVTLVSFEGQRQNNSSILLKWKTSMELNNKGFEIQRKTEKGEFESIAFIPSAFADGNSNELHAYQYTDNSTSGLTQYRLAQVDIDGRKTVSKVIIIKGSLSSELAVLIYPNPSTDGNVNLSFNDGAQKDLMLTDVSGKLVQSVKNCITPQYTLRNLRSGLYFLTIKQQSSGETITKKVMVR